jgi:HD-GYP domain-containing protein (c-di-GMP phosphodiesterase class II)
VEEILLSEVIAGLSYALDLTEGEPPGHARRSCLIGMKLADALGLDDETVRSDLFYALLLKDAGCSANSSRMASLFGTDDHAAKRTSKRVDWARPWPAFVWAARTAARGQRSPSAKLQRLLAIRDEGEVTRSLMQARCERGAQIARLLGLSETTAQAIYALDEHWDGAGYPDGLRGEHIPLGARVANLAQCVEIFWAAGGERAARALAHKRQGAWFDPSLVAALDGLDVHFWASLERPDLSPHRPPDRPLSADGDALDRIADGFAAVIDAKSPWTYRHSDRTSVIALSIAEALDADATTLRDLARAARLHDIGKLGVSNQILDKPAELTDAEFAAVKEHARITHTILARVPGLREVAPLASAHHERLDGSGYPYGWTADRLTMPMRALAVADVYDALTSERPYRPAHSSERALEVLRSEAPRRLDPDAVGALEALLAGARSSS